MPNNTSETEPIRHSSLYFQNGDIVLSARKGNEVVLFRVDRIFLARNSPVFEGMFELPPDPKNNETYDGVPLVHIPDDADDLAGLLGAIYNNCSIPLDRLSPNTPILVAGILKLATKYDIESIRTMILRHIQADWPQTLAEWDRRRAEVEEAKKAHVAQPDGKLNDRFLDDSFPEPASAIHLAKQFGCASILPAAYYQLAITPTELDWEASRVATQDMASYLRYGARSIRWGYLDREDLLRLLFARDQLVSLADAAEMLVRSVPGQLCEDPKGCSLARARTLVEYEQKKERPPDPLASTRYFYDTCGQWGVCRGCQRFSEQELLRLREKIWMGLAQIFGLSTP